MKWITIDNHEISDFGSDSDYVDIVQVLVASFAIDSARSNIKQSQIISFLRN